MKPNAAIFLIVICTIFLAMMVRFWFIAYRRGILRETLNYFHYEAFLDLLLVVLYCQQIYLLVKYYIGHEERFDWMYALAGTIAFICIALKKMDRIVITGIAHLKAVSTEYDQVMDGIDIKKKFKDYLKEVNR